MKTNISGKVNIVVGIGASAGGINVLENFFRSLPSDTGLTYVVIQHLAANHISMLAQILDRCTDMKVEEIQNNSKFEPNHVYITPPGKYVNISGDHFQLSQYNKNPQELDLPVDHFFRSLAQEKKNKSVAIIFSGAGKDGSIGIVDIKKEGGFVIAQEPGTARFESMPSSAINTGLADIILPPEEIAEYLINNFNKLSGEDKLFQEDNISEKSNYEKLVEKNKRKFQLLFNHNENPIALVESKGDNYDDPDNYKITEVNDAFIRIMKFTLDDIQSKKNSELWNDEGFCEELAKAGKNVLFDGSVQSEKYFEVLNKHFKINYFSYEKDCFACIFHDITALKHKLEVSQQLAVIVESSDDAIMSADITGKILTWNKAAMHLYGYSEDEAIGKFAQGLAAEPDKNGDTEMILKVVKGDSVKNFETFHQTKDGKIIPVAVTKSPVKDKDGKVVALSCIIKDITEVKNRENNLLQAKEASEKAALLKTTFLANISHELRTPLNSILGFTHLLHDTLNDEAQKKQVNTIYQSGKQLLHLINDLVDVSRLEAGELPVYKSAVFIGDLMDKVKDQFYGYKKQNEKDIEISLNIPKEFKELIVNTDEFRLQQVLFNLVSNAFKYTDEGLIELGCEIIDKKEIMFYVKDTGRGIEKEQQDIIFDRFKQLENPSKGVISGTGLGLSIAKGLIELLGGRIWLESELNKGSTFFFTIPYEKVMVSKRKKKANMIVKEEGIPQFKGKKILVAEDDPFSMEMLRHYLQATGSILFFAQDGEQSLELFKEQEIDLVLLDIRLPKKPGYEVVKEMKITHPEIPVIAQTAYAMYEDVHKFKERGFDEYLVKPLDSGKLYCILQKYLG